MASELGTRHVVLLTDGGAATTAATRDHPDFTWHFRPHAAVIEALTCGFGGACVDRRTNNGSLALHHAAANGHAAAALTLVKIMRSRGELQDLARVPAFMDTDALRNGWGVTASELARSKDHAALADAIELAVKSDAAASSAEAARALIRRRAHNLSTALRREATQKSNKQQRRPSRE